MKPVYILFLLIMSLAVSVNAYAVGSVLIVNCKGEDVGAEVLVNGNPWGGTTRSWVRS